MPVTIAQLELLFVLGGAAVAGRSWRGPGRTDLIVLGGTSKKIESLDIATMFYFLPELHQ